MVCGLLALRRVARPLATRTFPRWMPSWLAFAGAYVVRRHLQLGALGQESQGQRKSGYRSPHAAIGQSAPRIIGEYAEGAALAVSVLPFQCAGISCSCDARHSAIESLMELRPDEAMLLAADGSERRVGARLELGTRESGFGCGPGAGSRSMATLPLGP